VVDPWEGDIEIVDIAEIEENDDDIANELINIAINESMENHMQKKEDGDKTTNDNLGDNLELLLLQETIENDQTRSMISDEQSNPKDEEEREKPRKPYIL
jgi:hypothetical protein